MSIQQKSLARQGVSFLILSGIGWLVDFSLYLVLTGVFGGKVGISNFISAIPAVTFVFFASTKKTFVQHEGGLRLGMKYVIYVLYQFLLLLAVSSFGQLLYNLFLDSAFASIEIIARYIKIGVKVAITPLTMTINFIVMKLLIERL